MTGRASSWSPGGRSLGLATAVGLSSVAFWPELGAIARRALHEGEYSYLLAVPLISLGLLALDRKRLFAHLESRPEAAIVLLLILMLYRLGLIDLFVPSPSSRLFVAGLAITASWVSAFVLCYGLPAFRAGLFPLLFLSLMAPPPDFVVSAMIEWLQRASAEVSYLAFGLLQVPVDRTGFLFRLPGLDIEITEECSGIRSAIGLVVTALIAGHLFLRSGWTKLALMVVTLPLLVVKNAIRIVTLSLLSIYGDPTFFAGNLHRRGGAVFFALALVMLLPVLWALQRSEALSWDVGPVRLIEVEGEERR